MQTARGWWGRKDPPARLNKLVVQHGGACADLFSPPVIFTWPPPLAPAGIQVLPLETRAAAGQPAAVTALRMLCGPSVAALVQLAEPGSLVPLRAAFFAPAELQAGWGSQLFGQSRHLVFQRASGAAALALRHFVSLGSGADGQPAAQAGAGASPLELLLSWLATYSVRGRGEACLLDGIVPHCTLASRWRHAAVSQLCPLYLFARRGVLHSALPNNCWCACLPRPCPAGPVHSALLRHRLAAGGRP